MQNMGICSNAGIQPPNGFTLLPETISSVPYSLPTGPGPKFFFSFATQVRRFHFAPLVTL